MIFLSCRKLRDLILVFHMPFDSLTFFYPCDCCIQPKACAEAALSLLTCMEESLCVKKDGKSVIECMRNEQEAEGCKPQRNAYYLCKHSQLNMRTRIRGTRAY